MATPHRERRPARTPNPFPPPLVGVAHPRRDDAGGGRRRFRHRRRKGANGSGGRRIALAVPAIAVALSLGAIPSTPPPLPRLAAAMVIRTKEGGNPISRGKDNAVIAGFLGFKKALVEGRGFFFGGDANKTPAVVGRGEGDDVGSTRLSYGGDVEEGNDEGDDARISRHEGDHPRKKSAWRRVLGATVLLNVASYLLGMTIYKFETSCFRPRSVDCPRTVAALSLILLTIVAACQLFSKASRLISDGFSSASSRHVKVFGLLSASCGFLIPIVASVARSHRSASRSDISTAWDDDSDKADLATVDDEDDRLRCNTCNPGRRDLFLPAGESAPVFTPPRYITLGKRKGRKPPRSRKEEGETGGRRPLHFFHGLIVGAAVVSSCPEDEGTSLQVLVGAIALFHTIYLEQRVSAAAATFDDGHHAKGSRSTAIENWLHCMFSRSFLTLGGLVAVAAAECGGASQGLVVGAMLAAAGGAHVNFALAVALARVERHWMGLAHCDSAPPTSPSLRPRQRTHLEDDAPGTYWVTCPDEEDPVTPAGQRSRATPSRARPIPMREPSSQSGSASKRERSCLAGRYDRATWDMHARIVSAREAAAEHARCGLCMGSMEGDGASAPAILTVGEAARATEEGECKVIFPSRPREEEEEEAKRLIRCCPSSLHRESDRRGTAGAAMERTGLMMVHQECYYGSTGGGVCPHRKNTTMSEEMTVFQLEL